MALPTDSWATRLQAAAAVVASSAALLLCGGIVQALSFSPTGSWHLRMTAASRAASTQVGILAVLSVLLVALQRLLLSNEDGGGRLPEATLVLVLVVAAFVVAGGAFGVYDVVTGRAEFQELDFRTGAALERFATIGLGALAAWLALKVRADARAARDFYRDN